MSQAIPTMTLRAGDGRAVTIVRRLGGGGQGAVFEVAEAKGAVLKLYYPKELAANPELRDRLRVMVKNAPRGWRESKSHHILLTWPMDTVADSSGISGFLMSRIDSSKTLMLHQIANPSDARVDMSSSTPWARGFTWEYLVNTGLNIATAVRILHEAAIVIGDFNDANVLVWEDARVTLVDCDSMQVKDPGSQTYFLCEVGRPEFTPPELLNANWATTVRKPSSDLFALAIHLHQLLLEGEHPFRGIWRGTGDKPAAEILARDGLWVYSGDKRLAPRPSAMTIDLLPDEVRALFQRAFVEGATNPRHRPSAEEWQSALAKLAISLTTCKVTPSHRYRRDLKKCPWCLREQARSHRGRGATSHSRVPPAPVRQQRALRVPNVAPVPPAPPATAGRRVVAPPVPVVPIVAAPAIAPGRVRGGGVSTGSGRGGRRVVGALAAIALLVLAVLVVKHLSSGKGMYGGTLDSNAAAIVPTPSGSGYWLLSSAGSLYSFGDASALTGPGGTTNYVGMAATSDGKGLWLVTSGGGVFTVGDATSYGSLTSLGITDTITGIAATHDGLGYWLVGLHGAVYAFGDATYLGSPNQATSGWVSGIAADWVTGGYWCLGADGSVYAYHAPFAGSANTLGTGKLFVGIAADPQGGYWLASTDGGVFAYGAAFFGSMGGQALNGTVVGIASDPGQPGYWLLGSDGGLFAFGAAGFYGRAYPPN
jgi:hypothetical protein